MMPKFQRNMVGSRVRQWRDQGGLSQPELAAQCQRLGWDIGWDTIAKIEGRSRWVGDEELVPLARSLSVALEKLFPESVRRALPRQ